MVNAKKLIPALKIAQNAAAGGGKDSHSNFRVL